MKKPTIFKKIVLTLSLGLSTFIAVMVLDLFSFGNLDHPLTYAYQTISWLSCHQSLAPSCQAETALDPPVTGNNGVVVSTHHEASAIGLEILKQGGNAIDAAVVVGYALAVTDPCCGNLGGGGFMTIHLANGEKIFLNFREKAPLQATSNMYLDENGQVLPQKSREGYLAVGVQGTVLGLDQALAKYGTMSRQNVITPAIKLAENGFILTEADVRILKKGNRKFQDYNVANIFLKDGKNNYEIGDLLVQKDLAQTLKIIAEKGSDGFYQGEIAEKIVQASKEHNGILTLEDFQNYDIEETKPIECNYRGYNLISAPPPGGGVTVCQLLNILENYPLSELGFHSTKSIHYLLSAMVYAYSDRNSYLGDPNFVDIPLDQLLSKEYAQTIKNQIPEDQAIDPKPFYSNIINEGTNTTHYSVIDRYGNGVAVTYTINSYFGAGVIAQDTGFFLNNEMDDFTSKIGEPNQFGLVQGSANVIEPQKRPLSSMSPTIVTKNNRIFLITGSPGGSTIPTTVVQVITNIIDHQMNISEAVNAPRLHYQGSPNIVFNEPFAINNEVLQNLFDLGYKLAPLSNWGAAESILIDEKTGEFFGANDSRKPAGKALAY